jgi:hypothetical protein
LRKRKKKEKNIKQNKIVKQGIKRENTYSHAFSCQQLVLGRTWLIAKDVGVEEFLAEENSRGNEKRPHEGRQLVELYRISLCIYILITYCFVYFII